MTDELLHAYAAAADFFADAIYPHIKAMFTGCLVVGVIVLFLAVCLGLLGLLGFVMFAHPFVIAIAVFMMVAYWIGRNFEW